MVLQHPGALRKMFFQVNEIALGEAYIYNDFDIEGDIEAAFSMASHLFGMRLSLAEKIHLGRQLLKLPSTEKLAPVGRAAQLEGSPHSKERDMQAVTYHYNASNEFFALWLEPADGLIPVPISIQLLTIWTLLRSRNSTTSAEN